MLFDFLVAVYHIGRDYHSGQWSQWYQLQCQADQMLWNKWLYKVGNEELSINQLKLYHKLREKHFTNL